MTMPFIDLHLHLDGSLSIDTVKKLAAMQGIALPADDALARQLTVDPDCRDLNQYLEKFAFPLSLLQTAEAISLSVESLLEELAEEGHIYAELRFAPQLHCGRGMSQKEAVSAAIRGLCHSPIPCGLILCCMRGPDNADANRQTLWVAKEQLGRGVVAVDLAGAEALFSTTDYADLFALAREWDIPFTLHAGEADGADSVATALDMGPARIGHGVRSVEDAAVLARLAASGVPLELCPTSNLQTRVVNSLEHYPLPALLTAGVRVTVNTDNRTVSGTTMPQEWQKVINAFRLTREQVKAILLTAADAAFAEDTVKQGLREKIERW